MGIRFFKKKKLNYEKLVCYGFVKVGDLYSYDIDIFKGEFKLYIEISPNIDIKTKLVEIATNEEYTLHLVQNADGAFVGKVREEYESVLKDIADKCFEDEVFQSKEAKQVIKYVEEKYGDRLEYLWEKFPENAVCRRKDNKKWYLAILTVAKNKFGFDSDEVVEVIDLRALSEDIPDLIKDENIYPGYHMNKKHWITIIFDGSMSIEEIFERIDTSYKLALK